MRHVNTLLPGYTPGTSKPNTYSGFLKKMYVLIMAICLFSSHAYSQDACYSFIAIPKPTALGITTAGVPTNVTVDISSTYGLPAGSVILTVTNGVKHPTVDAFTVNASVQTTFTISGTQPMYMFTDHGNGLQSGSDGFISLDGVVYNYAGVLPIESGYINNSSGTTYQITNTGSGDGSVNSGIKWESSTFATSVKFFTTNTTAYNLINLSLKRPCDKDNDGVADVVDLDDDNDGVLDAVECPALAFKDVRPSDFGFPFGLNTSGTLSGTADISGKWGLPAGSVIVTVSGGSTHGSLDQFIAYNTATTVYTFSGTVPVKADISHGSVLLANKYEGILANDGKSYTFTTTCLDPGLVYYQSGDSMMVKNTNTTNANNSCGIYRWLSNTAVTQLSTYTNAALNSNVTRLSLQPLYCPDTDGDGIANVEDLDSDNDGCNDIYESSVSISNTPAIAPSPYGANGFSNSVETSTESGVYNGTYTYSKAIDSTVNACTDGLKTNPDINATFVNVPVTGNINTNDTVPAGTTYSNPVAQPGNPAACTPTINSNGTYTFTCATVGEYNFLVDVCAPGVVAPNCLKSLLTITVTGPNTTNPPVANTDIATTLPATPVGLSTLDNDKPGTPGSALVPSTVTVIDAPSNGTTSVNPTTGEITYTPNAGFTGTDTLTYQVCDNQSPPMCATAIEIITVKPATAPNTTTAADDYNTTLINTPVAGTVITNDSDAEGNTQTITPQTTTIPGKGTLVLNADGTYTFTPVTGFTGPVEYPYTTCDNGTPQACTQATLHILVAPAPVCGAGTVAPTVN